MGTDGFVATAAGLRFSARSPLPSFVIAATSLLAWTLASRRAAGVGSDLRAIDLWLRRSDRRLVAAIAAAAALLAIVWGSSSATGADASGYLSHSAMLADLRLTRVEPLAALATWTDGAATLAPLGWRAAAGDIQVPTYAVGLPLLMAPGHALGGATAAWLVVPLWLAASIVIAGALARRLAGTFAALAAAVWVATSPIVLFESMQVMSDVPVTGAWLACWWLVFEKRPAAGGLAAALAVLVRPNLAPLAALPCVFLLLRSGSSSTAGAAAVIRADDSGTAARIRWAAAFALPVAASGLAVGALQWLWFGSPFRSGYGTAAEIYAIENVWPNVRLYGGWLLDTHGPWLLAAPLALATLSGRSRREAAMLLAFAASVVVAYLVYARFETWPYLRFLLPALGAAMVLAGAVVAAALARVPPTLRAPLLLATLVALTAVNIAEAHRLEIFALRDRHARARVVGEALARQLPAGSVIISGEQSGAMRYYTGRSILRWDLVAPADLGPATVALAARGLDAWVVLDDWEEEPFRRKFPDVAALSIDAPPAFESARGVGIRTRAWRVRTGAQSVARPSSSGSVGSVSGPFSVQTA